MNQNRHASPLQKLQNRSSFKPSFKNLISIQQQKVKSTQKSYPAVLTLSQKQKNKSAHHKKFTQSEKQNKFKNEIQNQLVDQKSNKNLREFEKNAQKQLQINLQKISEIEQALNKHEQIIRNRNAKKKENDSKMHKSMKEFSRLKRIYNSLEQYSNEMKIQTNSLIQLYDKKISEINLMCNQVTIKDSLYMSPTNHDFINQNYKNDELEQKINRLEFLLR